MLCPCRDNKESFVLYQSDQKNNKIDVKCTSEIHSKPTLYKCKKCGLVFSEYANSSFEEAYTNVEDKKYIQQIPFKKNILIFFSVKLNLF